MFLLDQPVIQISQSSMIGWFGIVVGVVVMVLTAWINLRIGFAVLKSTVAEMELRVLSHEKEMKETKTSLYSKIDETNLTLHRIELHMAKIERYENGK